ncbi:MAG: PAS domain S-box protein, partial [Anaerolineales bacterium]|nr:PAS domain S-box protein [Anaerolineales bacterium]
IQVEFISNVYQVDHQAVIQCNIRDITERKRTEQELNTSEVRYRRLFDTAQDGILILNAETGMILDVNPFLIKMLGFSHEQFLGKKIWELGIFKDIAANQANFAKLQQQEYIRYEDLPLETNDGRQIQVEFISNVYQVDHQTVIQCNIRDITERKRAGEALQQRTTQLEAVNKELEAFTYSVSHDLRAPLRGIDGWSLALLEDYGNQLDGQAKTYLEQVRSETQHMGNLIDDLLQLSHLTSTEMSIQRVDLSAIAGTLAASLKKSQPDRQVVFVIQPGLNANGDVQLLEIALTNLLDNAFKFTGKTPQARIQFGRTEMESQRTFFVRDNGAGFDMALAKNLFKAFQRMHKASDFPGTGIGLTTVQRIVDRHGGRVWAEACVNKGATFYFTLEEAV